MFRRPVATSVVAAWMCWGSFVLADDVKTPKLLSAEKQALLHQVHEIEQEKLEIQQHQTATQAEMTELRKQATDFQRTLQSLTRQLEQIQADQKRLEESIPKQEAAAKEAAEKRRTAEELAKKAQEEAEKAAKEADEAAKKPDESRKRLVELSELLPAVVAALPKAQADYAPFPEKLEALQVQLDSFHQQLAKSDERIESLLQQAGVWISFSQDIAPILQSRCLACHNARDAKGQFNLANYAALLTTGESGSAVIPGDDEFSTLCIMLEDGSMPQDAEPLGAEQIRLIRNWVKLGAKLDTQSNPRDPLIRIMPRIEQPAPPQKYRVPIPVTALALLPNAKLVASSGYHEVLLWSMQDQNLVRRIPNIAERVHGLAFSPNGEQIAVASGTPGRLGEVKLFSVESGELVADLFVAEDEVFDVKFSPDGHRLAACGADGTIAVFDLSQNDSVPELLDDHSDWVQSIDWSLDGSQLVSASRDQTAKVFDADSGELLVTFAGHGQSVVSAMFLPDGKQIASLGADRYLRIWNSKNAKESEKKVSLDGEPVKLRTLDEKHLLIATDRSLSTFDHQEGKQFDSRKSPSVVTSVALTVGGTFIGALDGTISIWSAGQPEATTSWTAVP